MRPSNKLLILAGFLLSLAPFADSATISGTVKGPDGKPFKGAFVEAQNLFDHDVKSRAIVRPPRGTLVAPSAADGLAERGQIMLRVEQPVGNQTATLPRN